MSRRLLRATLRGVRLLPAVPRQEDVLEVGLVDIERLDVESRQRFQERVDLPSRPKRMMSPCLSSRRTPGRPANASGGGGSANVASTS